MTARRRIPGSRPDSPPRAVPTAGAVWEMVEFIGPFLASPGDVRERTHPNQSGGGKRENHGPPVERQRLHFARPCTPCASMATFHTAPPPTIYNVFLSGPAKATACAPSGVGIVPRCSPFGLNTLPPPMPLPT